MTCFAGRWDALALDTARDLIEADAMDDHATTVLRLKTRDGGVGIPSIAALSPIAYDASIVGVMPCLADALPRFADAVRRADDLPPINPGEASDTAATLTTNNTTSIPTTTSTNANNDILPAPGDAVERTWRTVTAMPEGAVKELFGMRADDTIDQPLTAAAFLADRAAGAKIQRALAGHSSRQSRQQLINTHINTITTTGARSRSPTVWDDAVRSLVHARAGWQAFHDLAPTTPALRVQGWAFAATVRFHLRLRSRVQASLPPTLLCRCRGKMHAPNLVDNPSYHAHTCGFGARLRKSTHNHIVHITAEALNRGNTVTATELPRNESELSGGGAVPDIALEAPAGATRATRAHDHADITIASLVTAKDYAASRASILAGSDHKPARFNAKLVKHGPRDIPVVFDVTGAIDPRSHRFLASNMKSKAELRFYYKRVAASLARMVGSLDRRNTRAWMHQSPSGSTLTPREIADEARRLDWFCIGLEDATDEAEDFLDVPPIISPAVPSGT
jgi:hypothetical protein